MDQLDLGLAPAQAVSDQPLSLFSSLHSSPPSLLLTHACFLFLPLHRAPSVRYSKPMPDIEALMQIWPAPIEELLEQNPLPDADINLDLASYVRVVCSMLDIPVYDSLTQSLHVLFTLYSDFKANVHFQQQLANEGEEQGGQMGGFGGGYGGGETLDLS